MIEVTERFGARTTTVVRTLHRLRAQGFKLALDDVGTGNAGLEMLHALGAEFVKIDRSIVAGAPSEPNARAVLLAMAMFARQTGAFVIAEGIEDDELLRYVRTIDDRLRPAPTRRSSRAARATGSGDPPPSCRSPARGWTGTPPAPRWPERAGTVKQGARRGAHPPATAGRIWTSCPSATGVCSPSVKRMSSPST